MENNAIQLDGAPFEKAMQPIVSSLKEFMALVVALDSLPVGKLSKEMAALKTSALSTVKAMEASFASLPQALEKSVQEATGRVKGKMRQAGAEAGSSFADGTVQSVRAAKQRVQAEYEALAATGRIKLPVLEIATANRATLFVDDASRLKASQGTLSNQLKEEQYFQKQVQALQADRLRDDQRFQAERVKSSSGTLSNQLKDEQYFQKQAQALQADRLRDEQRFQAERVKSSSGTLSNQLKEEQYFQKQAQALQADRLRDEQRFQAERVKSSSGTLSNQLKDEQYFQKQAQGLQADKLRDEQRFQAERVKSSSGTLSNQLKEEQYFQKQAQGLQADKLRDEQRFQAERLNAIKAANALIAKDAQFNAVSPASQLRRAVTVANATTGGMSDADAATKWGAAALAASKNVGVLQVAQDSLKASGRELGAEKVRLSDRQSSLNKAMNEGHSAARGLASGFGALYLTYGSLIPLLAGAAISNAAVQAVRIGAEVGQSLAVIQNLGGATAEEMVKLNAALLETSRTGPFGPKEVAKALETLSLAGLSAKEQMEALKPTLDFAVAGQMSIEKSAGTLVAISTAFGYQAQDMRVVSDIITKTAAISMASAESMASSFRVASVVAQQYNVSLTDVATTLALLAQIGIKDQAAGTAVRQMYSELIGTSAKARRVMRDVLKFDAFDDLGKSLKPLPQMFTELAAAFVKLDVKSQNRALLDMGNERAAKAMVANLRAVQVELGNSAREFQKTGLSAQESMARAREAVTSNMEKIRQELADAPGFSALAAIGLSNSTQNQMKTALSGLQTTLVEAFQAVEPVVARVATQLQTLFKSDEFRTAITAMVSAVVELTGWLVKHFDLVAVGVISYYGATLGLGALTAATALFSAAAAGAAVSMGALALTMLPLTLLALAVGGAYYYLTRKVDETSEAQKNAQATAARTIAQVEAESERLRILIEFKGDETAAREETARVMQETTIETIRQAGEEKVKILQLASGYLELAKAKEHAQGLGLSDRGAGRRLADLDKQIAKIREQTGAEMLNTQAIFDQARERARLARDAAEARKRAAAGQGDGVYTGDERGAAANKNLTAMLALTKASKDHIAVLNEQLSTEVPLTQSEKKLAELKALSTQGFDKAALAARAYQLALLPGIITLENLIVARKAEADSRAADSAALQSYTKATEQNLERLREEADLHNLNSIELQKITSARTIDKAAQSAVYEFKKDAQGVDVKTLKVTTEMAAAILAKAEADKVETKSLVEKINAQKLSVQYEQDILNLKVGNKVYLEPGDQALEKLKAEASIRQKNIDSLKEDTQERRNLIAQNAEWYALSQENIGVEKFRDLWQSVDKTAQATFVNIFYGGQTAFTKLRDTLKSTLLDLLYQMTVKKWVFNITASVSGAFGMAGAANAAAGTGAGSGDIMGSLSAGKSIYDAINGGFASLGSSVTNGFTSFATSSAGQAMGLSNATFGIGAEGAGVAMTESAASMAASAGSFATIAGAAAAGIGIGSMLAGNKVVLGLDGTATSAIGTAIGFAVGGIPGAVIGGVLGGLTNAMFGNGPTQVVGSGIRGSLSANGGLTGNSYTNTHSDGGWFSSDKNETINGALSGDLVKFMNGAVALTTSSTQAYAKAIGLSAEAVAGYTQSIDLSLMGLDAKGQEDAIGQILSSFASGMASVYTELAGFAKEGEASSATLARLATSLASVNGVLDLLHLGLMKTSVVGADAASKLIDAFGGLEKMAGATNTYYDSFYTDEEKRLNTIKQINAATVGSGLDAANANRDSFRALVEAQDLTTASGQKTFVALVGVAGAFASIVPVAATVSVVFEKLVESLKTALGSITSETTAVANAKLQISPAPQMSREQIASSVDSTRLSLPADASLVAANARLSVADADLKGTKDRFQLVTASYNSVVEALGATQRGFDSTVNYYRGLAAQVQGNANGYEVSANSSAQAGGAYAYNAATNQLADFSSVTDATRTGRAYKHFLSDSASFLQSVASQTSALAGGNQALAASARTLAEAKAVAAGRESEYAAASRAYAADLASSLAAQAVAVAQARAAQTAYTDSLQALAVDSQKAVTSLSALREQTVSYYEAQKALAGLMTTSAAGLRAAVQASRMSQLSSAQALAERQQQFASNYSMALATTGSVQVGYADKLSAALPDLSSALMDVSATRSEWVVASAQLASQALSLAGLLEAAAPKDYVEQSLALLDSINTALAGLQANTLSADQLVTNAIKAGSDQTAAGLRAVIAALTGQAIPAFAAGGSFSGGLRIVGENGPELEATGPSRIYNAAQTRSMLGGAGGNANTQRLEALVELLTAEVQGLRTEAQATAQYTSKTVRILDRVSQGGDALKTVAA